MTPLRDARTISTSELGGCVLAILALCWSLAAVADGAATPPSGAPPESDAEAGPSAAVAAPIEESDAAADEDPRSLVVFNLRLQHVELGDGNSIDLVLLRRDAAIRRPGRPNIRFATLRWDLPVGQSRINGEEAAGLGDLGAHFPDTDPQWSGANSLMILGATADMVRQAGWTIGNVDVKVVCERPKLAPRKDEMERNLSDAVGAPVSVAGRRAVAHTPSTGSPSRARRLMGTSMTRLWTLKPATESTGSLLPWA